MRRLSRINPPLLPVPAPAGHAPMVSVIIPAKNEEKNISNVLTHLFKQTFPNFEIMVVDDRSTDQTPHLLEDLKKSSPVPFKIIRIDKLPAGWTGKNYAMFTASKAAVGQWFLFTDADTTHRRESIATAVSCVIERKIDFLTLAPEVECRSFWEKTVQPLAISSLALWFRSDKINDPRHGVTLANGQFILIRRQVYENVGGNESIKNEVVEDVELAKKIREQGYRVQFLNGTRIYSTRMYSTLEEIKTGWTRIFTYLFKKKISAIFHKIFLFLCFSLLPFAVFAAETFFYAARSTHFNRTLLILSAGVSLWIVLIRFIGNKILKTNPWYATLHPLGSLVMIWILLACVGRIVFRRPSAWRGDLHH